jgi:hypothetical protein
MSVIGSNILAGASGQGGGYNLTNSLRFRSSASAYLNRTPASAGNRQTWTYSVWVKRGALGRQSILATPDLANTNFNIQFTSNDTFSITNYQSTTNIELITTQVFRDPSAWYHIVVALDTTQATASNRVRLWVNGVQVTSFSTATYPSQNLNADLNTAVAHTIGSRAFNGSPFLLLDGYLTEVNFIDGQALTPSSFGENNASTGVWQPKRYSGTYGTNGFYLPFSNNASTTTLGNDFSGNGNNWTTNNISLTAGSTYDSMTDVPTLTSATAANTCTLNPLSVTAGSMTDGNLYYSANTAGFYGAKGTIELPTTGKYYFEARLSTSGTSNSSGGDYTHFGVIVTTTNTNNAYDRATFCTLADNGWVYNFDTNTNAAGSALSSGDVIAMAIDRTANTYTFYRNNTSIASGTLGVASGTSLIPILYSYGSTNGRMSVNFGQQPFAYTPPTGFVALNTFNLPTPTIGATASTQANKYMDASLYTGNGSSVTVTNSGSMQPDFVWVKIRSGAGDHYLADSVRGVSRGLYTNATNAENFESGRGITSFNSNGFGVGLDPALKGSTNLNGATYVGWQWKGGGTGITNTDGSITSTVSANTSAGFSVVTFTSPASGTCSVGHGLGVKPSMVIVKCRSVGNSGWFVWHQALGDNNTDYLELFRTVGEQSYSTMWGTVGRTSTLLGFTQGGTLQANATHVAYAFSEVAGYSKFGSYTGNGSADGTFVYTGFRPRYFMVKRADASGNDWILMDTARDPINVATQELYANLSNAEGTAANNYDILSNGFKARRTNVAVNASGSNYIYMAFAENPFKYSLAR